MSNLPSERTLLLAAVPTLLPTIGGRPVSVGAVRIWAQSGKLEAFKLGNRWLTSVEAVARFLVPPTTEEGC